MCLKNYSKREEFGNLYQEFYLTGIGAEIGVKKGKFSRQILNYWKGILLCIDVWDNCEDYLDAKKILLPDVILIKQYSTDAALEIKDESLDFVSLVFSNGNDGN